jgi:hypothetical protein
VAADELDQLANRQVHQTSIGADQLPEAGGTSSSSSSSSSLCFPFFELPQLALYALFGYCSINSSSQVPFCL